MGMYQCFTTPRHLLNSNSPCLLTIGQRDQVCLIVLKKEYKLQN